MTKPPETQARILIVDDDAGSRLLMRSALERGHFSVIEAPDGAAAVALVGQDLCDAVLMDVEMPRMDGFTACAAIRNMPKGANLPIMVVTGRNDLQSVDRAYEVGATDFLPKPINWGLLAHRVRYLVRGGRLVQALNASERRHRALLGAMPDLLLVVDSCDRVVDQLGATSRHPLIGPEGANGRSLRSLVGDSTAESLEQAVGASRSMGRQVELEFDARTTLGERRFETRVLPYDTGRTLLLLRDVTERHHSQARIHELAYFDALTKLPNREFFEQSLTEAITDARGSGETFALIRIGVAGLKRIHESLGSTIGDGVTIAVSERLQSVLGSMESGPEVLPLARLATDEFVVLARHVTGLLDVEQLNRRIVQSFAQALHHRQRDFFLTTYTGASLFPEHATNVDMLMRAASAALGVAKDSGATRSVIYDKTIHDRTTARLELETDLYRALDNHELFVVYQPQVEIATGRIVGVESLVRWRHPTRGIVPPDEFIPIAEAAGLIERVSEFVLRESLRQVTVWRASGVDNLRVAVNISGLHFAGSEFARWVESELAAARMPGAALELEITESMLIADEATAGRTLAAVRALGVHVAIDDFGTGYSSLAYLQNFALESLKVDRSFVAGLVHGRRQAAICSAIIAMGRQLGLRIVAEGVESVDQLAILRDLGCTVAQGYFIARPMPAAETSVMLENWRKAPGAGLDGFVFGTPQAPISDAEAEAVLQRGLA